MSDQTGRRQAPFLPGHACIADDVAWNTLNLVLGLQISPQQSLMLRAGIDIAQLRAARGNPGVGS